jgi:hypothetical protein
MGEGMIFKLIRVLFAAILVGAAAEIMGNGTKEITL